MKDSGIPKLHQHAVCVRIFLGDVFKEKDRVLKIGLERRSHQARENAQVAADKPA